jgi:hypothetical protein
VRGLPTTIQRWRRRRRSSGRRQSRGRAISGASAHRGRARGADSRETSSSALPQSLARLRRSSGSFAPGRRAASPTVRSVVSAASRASVGRLRPQIRRCRLGAVPDAELPVDARDVVLDRVDREAQAAREFIVRETLREQLEHLALARRELAQTLRGGGCTPIPWGAHVLDARPAQSAFPRPLGGLAARASRTKRRPVGRRRLANRLGVAAPLAGTIAPVQRTGAGRAPLRVVRRVTLSPSPVPRGQRKTPEKARASG